MKEWQRELPPEVAEVLSRGHKYDTDKAYSSLRSEQVGVVTPIVKMRSLAKFYSRKYKVPIKISAKAFTNEPTDTEAMFSYNLGRDGSIRGIVYLHPILQFYPEKYVRGVILHELDHCAVERKWEKIL